MKHKKFGIYLNKREIKVARGNSPYWLPKKPDWTFLTPEVNMTLIHIRQLAKKRNLVSDPGKIDWV